jgi:hypothetical protein
MLYTFRAPKHPCFLGTDGAGIVAAMGVACPPHITERF